MSNFMWSLPWSLAWTTVAWFILLGLVWPVIRDKLRELKAEIEAVKGHAERLDRQVRCYVPTLDPYAVTETTETIVRRLLSDGREWRFEQLLRHASGRSESTVRHVLKRLMDQGEVSRQGEPTKYRYKLKNQKGGETK